MKQDMEKLNGINNEELSAEELDLVSGGCDEYEKYSTLYFSANNDYTKAVADKHLNTCPDCSKKQSRGIVSL